MFSQTCVISLMSNRRQREKNVNEDEPATLPKLFCSSFDYDPERSRWSNCCGLIHLQRAYTSHTGIFQSSGLKDEYKRPIRKQCDATMRSLPSRARLVGYGDENGRDITGTLINFSQGTDHPDVVQFSIHTNKYWKSTSTAQCVMFYCIIKKWC